MCIRDRFRNDIPIYTQLIAQIQQRIVSGALLPGERLPSVRDLAAEAGVNPNTMQRAMMEMEREELVYSQRTAGRFVTEDGERIRRLRESLALSLIHISPPTDGLQSFGRFPSRSGYPQRHPGACTFQKR